VSVDTADVAFDVRTTPDSSLVVTALAGAGILRHPEPVDRAATDPTALLCVAPESGYATADTIPLSSSSHLYFFRARDGEFFARFVLVPKGFKQRDPRSGPRAGLVPVWINLGGGRGLCGPEPRFWIPNEFRAQMVEAPESTYPRKEGR
jgi:hypothetical protein